MPITYPDNMKVRDALNIYFSAHNFDQGGYNDKFYYIVLGPLKLPIPNTKKRIMAVKFHDIHHLLTNYSAFWKGEIQIGAWELASGCGIFFVAWFLNFGSFGVGLFLYPRLLFRAFMNGRSVKANLYHGVSYDDDLLDRSLGDLRRELGVGLVRKVSFQDHLLFSFWALLVLIEAALVVSVLCLLVERIIH